MSLAFSTATYLGNAHPSSTLTGAFTCNSGPNDVLYVLIEGDSATDKVSAGTVTFGGVAMSLVGSSSGSGTSSARWTYLYELFNPPNSGSSQNVVITATGSCDFLIATASYYTSVANRTAFNFAQSTGTATATVTTTIANSWLLAFTRGGTANTGTITGYTKRAYDTAFNDSAVWDTNGTVTVGSHSAVASFSSYGNEVYLVALAPYNPGFILPGQVKKTGIPRINWNHPLAKELLFYGFDTGLGFVINLCPGAAITPGLGNNTYNGGSGGSSTVSAPTQTTPYGVATYWYEWGGSYSGAPGGTQPGYAAWADVQNASFQQIVKASRLYNQGIGAGNTFATGFLHQGTANNNTTGGSGNPGAASIGCWIFGRPDDAAEAGNYVTWGFYKATNDPSNIYCQLETGTPSSPSPVSLGPFASGANTYTTLACSTLNSSSGSGTSTFYAQGVSQATQASVAMCDRPGNNEEQIMFGGVYHVSTGETIGPLDGFVYWGAFWGRALTALEHQQLNQDPYCFLVWDDIFDSIIPGKFSTTFYLPYVSPYPCILVQ